MEECNESRQDLRTEENGIGKVKTMFVRRIIHYNTSNHGACLKQAKKPRFCHARMKPKQMTWEDMQS